MQPHNNHSQAGFALFLSLIVLSVVISVMLSLLDITIKQLNLATLGKGSESAFYAASAGIDCIHFHRQNFQDNYERGDSVAVSCFPSAVIVGSVSDTGFSSPRVFHYSYEIPWPSGTNRCSIVSMLTLNSNPGEAVNVFNRVHDYIPSSPRPYISCPSGGRCTLISVKGYNVNCTDIGRIGVIEREVLIEL